MLTDKAKLISLDPQKKLSVKAEMEVGNPHTSINGILTFDPDGVFKPSDNPPNHPASFDLDEIQKDPKKHVDAQIVECDPAGRYRLVSYDKEGLHDRLNSAPVIESAPAQPISLREAIAEKYGSFLREDFGRDRLMGPSGAGGIEPFARFTPLFMGPYYRQQYLYRMLEAKSKCFEAYTNNPIAHRIPSLITQFTLGKGVTVSCQDDKTRKVWDQFATYNKIGTSMSVGLTRAGARLRMWSNQLSVDGENMFQFIDRKDNLYVKALDTATVLDIVTDPEDLDKVHYYHQQFSTRYMQYVNAGIDSIKYVIRQIPGADVLHTKINVYENEARGRSDLYSIIGYLKRTKDLVNANVIKAYFQACYTWDVMVDGDPRTVQALANKYKNYIPTPGSQYFHNKNITRTPFPPVSGTGAGTDNDMLGLMNLISLGCGVPPVFLIGTMAQNRASVLTETEPSTKFFFERQSVWDETLHGFFERLSRWHYEKTGEMLNENIEFSFPVINAVEKQAHLAALGTMRDSRWFADKRCAELAAKEWNVTSYDYEDEQNDIAKEEKDRVEKELEITKMKSAAQSHLSLWQRILADKSAKEEVKTLGPTTPPDERMDPATGQPAQPGAQPQGKPQAKQGGSNVPKAGPTSGKRPAGNFKNTGSNANSGGITDGERAQTEKALSRGKGKD